MPPQLVFKRFGMSYINKFDPVLALLIFHNSRLKKNVIKFPIIGTSLAWIVEERLESKPTEVSFAWSFDKALLAREVYEREGRRHPDRMYQIYFEVMVADTE